MRKKTNIKQGHLIQTLKVPYGLAEGGACRGAKTRKHLEDALGSKYCTFDTALFFSSIKDIFSDICATNADDTLHPGGPKYFKLTKPTEAKFIHNGREQK